MYQWTGLFAALDESIAFLFSSVSLNILRAVSLSLLVSSSTLFPWKCPHFTHFVVFPLLRYINMFTRKKPLFQPHKEQHLHPCWPHRLSAISPGSHSVHHSLGWARASCAATGVSRVASCTLHPLTRSHLSVFCYQFLCAFNSIGHISLVLASWV